MIRLSPRGQQSLLAVALYLIAAALLATVGPYARVRAIAGRLGPPEERPGLSTAAVSIFLGRIGDHGRDLYAQAQVLDFASPLLFAVAGWSIVSWARSGTGKGQAWASVVSRLVILTVAAGVIENTLLLTAVGLYPSLPLLGQLIGPAVTVRFGLVAVTSASLVALAALALTAERPENHTV